MDKIKSITEHFKKIETIKEHNGYFCKASEAIIIVILGSICGLRNINQIHQWASSEQVSEFLSKHFKIAKIPCYYWLLTLLKIIKPESLNQCFISWVTTLLPKDKKNLTISCDGKSVCSTGKMAKYDSPLHIVSAQIAELGITFGQQTVSSKSNEIPAVQELIHLLKIQGCVVVADALNCQKDTAKAITEAKADYLLCVKENHKTLHTEISEYIQDESLQKAMDTCKTIENNRGRIEHRTAYSTTDINWLFGKEEWTKLASIGAIHTKVTTGNKISEQWHYYISSKTLSAKELLNHARLEWSVETMHWLLDVHFAEDSCRLQEKNTQQNLNMARKIALNCIKSFKLQTEDKRPISKIMFACLLDCHYILNVCGFKN